MNGYGQGYPGGQQNNQMQYGYQQPVYQPQQSLTGFQPPKAPATDEKGEPLPVIDISQAEVVRRQYFSHTKESSVTIRPDGIQFNAACLERFYGVTHILLLVDWSRNWLIIKSCDKDDKDGQRWCNVKGDKYRSRKIKGNDFARLLYQKLNWCKGKYYKICGTMAVQKDTDDELLMVFNFADKEEGLMSKKARESAGVSDSEISKEDLDQLEEYEILKQMEKEERDAAKARGEAAPKSKRENRFPSEWDGNMGDKYSEYQPKVEFPHLPENNAEAEQMGFGVFNADAGANTVQNNL